MQPRAHRTGSRGVTIPKKCINNQLTKLKVYRIVNNCNWGILLHRLLRDWGRIAEQSLVCIPASIGRLEQKCLQLTTKRGGRSQQLQLCRQPVPCTRCGNEKSLFVNSSTRAWEDEVARRQGMQCRSCWHIGDRYQQVRYILWWKRTPKKTTVCNTA